MASTQRLPVTSQHHELCHPTVHLLRKMRSDVSTLLESYAEKQGLDTNFSLDSIDGVPVADTEHWSEISDAERLGINLKAYWAFEILLDEILEEQRSNLTPTDDDFHKSIQSVMLQVSALAYQLEELMVILNHNVPTRELEGTRGTGKHGLFEKKMRGMKVLQELAQWTVRSVRDLHQVSKSLQAGIIPCKTQHLAHAQEK
ncbi:ciliary neurotrophic factor [Sceloporus undulatus]|uniref:ciliary neurotrophic factor n=1 Tax=Sceloporus undulatus TaxID=8520 RepID=UPI001C4AFB92|nr:ciliary neurotrophic factor [Sceloporus undulatus]